MADNTAITTSVDAHYMCDTLRRVNTDIPIRSGDEPQLVPVHLRLSCDLVFADESASRWRVRPTTEGPRTPVTNAEWRRLKTRWFRLFRGVSQVGRATREQAGSYMSHAFYVTGRREGVKMRHDEPIPDTLETMVFVVMDGKQRERWINGIRVAIDPFEKPSVSTNDTVLRQAILSSMSPCASTSLSSCVTGAGGPCSAVMEKELNWESGGEKLISKIADEMVRGAETMDDTRKIFGIIVNSVTKAADVIDDVFVGQPFVGAGVHVVTMAVKAGAIIAEVSQMGGNLKSLGEECHKMSQRIFREMLAGVGGSRWGEDYFERLKEILVSVEEMTRMIERACVGSIFEKVRLRELVGEIEERIMKMKEELKELESFGHIKLMCEESLGILKDIQKEIQSVVRRRDACRRHGSLRKDRTGVRIDVEGLRALGRRAPPEVPSTYVSGMDVPEGTEYKVKKVLLSGWESKRRRGARVVLLGIGGSGKSTACMGVASDEEVLEHYGKRITWLQFNDSGSFVRLNEAIMTIVSVICGEEAAVQMSNLDESEFMSAAREVIRSEYGKLQENMLFFVDDIWNVSDLKAVMSCIPNRASVVVTTRLPKAADLIGGAEEIVVEGLPGNAARELLGRRMGRSGEGWRNGEWFTRGEEEEFVERIMKETDQVALAVDIVGCILKSRDGAWEEVLKMLEGYSVAHEKIEYPFERVSGGESLNGCESVNGKERRIHRSIGGALKMSVEMLEDQSLMKSFIRMGVLPANDVIVSSALCILWGEKVLDRGECETGKISNTEDNCERDDLSVCDDEKEGARVEEDEDESGEDRRGEISFKELDKAGVRERIQKLRDIGLVNIGMENGKVRGIWIHSTVRAFAMEMLRERGKKTETHRDLIIGYGARHEFEGRDEDGLVWYPIWELNDDGYVLQNIARHAEEGCNAAVACKLGYAQWRDVRERKYGGAAYQSDIEHGCRTLEVYLNSLSSIQDGDKIIGAKVYFCLGNLFAGRQVGDRSSNVEKGIRYYEEALEVYNRESCPSEWAHTKMNLGNALFDKPNGDAIENNERSVRCYEEALEVYNRESYPSEWAMTKMNLGVVLRNKPNGDAIENNERSVRCYEEALQVLTRESYPSEWARTKMNLGIALGNKPNGDAIENNERSVRYFEEALQVYNRESYPSEWAMTKMNLGVVLRNKPNGDAIENNERAVQYYEEALEVYTEDIFPEQYLDVHSLLEEARRKQNVGRITWYSLCCFC